MHYLYIDYESVILVLGQAILLLCRTCSGLVYVLCMVYSNRTVPHGMATTIPAITVPYRTYCGAQRHGVRCTYIIYMHIYELACIGRTHLLNFFSFGFVVLCCYSCVSWLQMVRYIYRWLCPLFAVCLCVFVCILCVCVFYVMYYIYLCLYFCWCVCLFVSFAYTAWSIQYTTTSISTRTTCMYGRIIVQYYSCIPYRRSVNRFFFLVRSWDPEAVGWCWCWRWCLAEVVPVPAMEREVYRCPSTGHRRPG